MIQVTARLTSCCLEMFYVFCVMLLLFHIFYIFYYFINLLFFLLFYKFYGIIICCFMFIHLFFTYCYLFPQVVLIVLIIQFLLYYMIFFLNLFKLFVSLFIYSFILFFIYTYMYIYIYIYIYIYMQICFCSILFQFCLFCVSIIYLVSLFYQCLLCNVQIFGGSKQIEYAVFINILMIAVFRRDLAFSSIWQVHSKT